MRYLRIGVVASVALWITWAVQPSLRANNHLVFINEVMAGANGNSRIQFIEMMQRTVGQNCWGPQVLASTPGADESDDDCPNGPFVPRTGFPNETRSRAMLVFFDAQDREIARFKFPENPPTTFPDGGSVLIATQEFAALPGAPVPDFIMPPFLSPVSGKVCFRGNRAENVSAFEANLCLSYGAFTGNTEELSGVNAAALPVVNAQSLGRTGTDRFNTNAEFTLGVPTPTNNANRTFNMTVLPDVQQGEALFKNETFMGNGRTCAQCHIANLSFRLTPDNVTTRFANLANTFETQFIAETAATGFDFNLNTLAIAARPQHQSGTDFNNTSGGDLQGIITTAGGGRAKIAAKVGAQTYLIFGGISPMLAGTVTDALGNAATVTSVTAGGLDALEVPSRMRSSAATGLFPNGRALILENIDGFANPPVFRKSPHLLNMRLTGPFGFSGDIPDLRTFSTGAVRQHFPRTLGRSVASTPGSAPDFRLPTAQELVVLDAFMQAQEFPPGNDPDKFNLNRFVNTLAQQRGRDAFFGAAKCSQCHGGPVLATTTISIQGKPIGVNAAFDTGVATQILNTVVDNLPCEPTVGAACNTREFSTPQLFNVKNLGPWFHDASAPTLRAAVEFYDSPIFNSSPAGLAIGGIALLPPMLDDIVAFLEGLSALPTHTITGLDNRTMPEDSTPAPFPFTVAPATVTLTGSSSNTALVPNANIVFGGSGTSRTIRVTPAPNQFGTSTITVNSSDEGGSASTSFLVTVNNVNDPPTIGVIPNLTIDEDSVGNALNVTVNDIDNEVATLTLSSSTTDAALHTTSFGGADANRTVTITPSLNRNGAASVTVTVSDGNLPASRTFLLTVNPVNDAPTISAIGDVTVDEDTNAHVVPCTVDDVDTPLDVLVLSTSSNNPSLQSVAWGGSGTNRTVTIVPLANQFGTSNITITANDGTLPASRTFVLTVNPVNDPPVISLLANQTVNEDSGSSSFAFTLADDGTAPGSITLSSSSTNPGLHATSFGGADANRTVIVTPLPDQNGSSTITITAADGASSSSRSFTVTVNPVNDGPTISPLADVTVDEDTGGNVILFTVDDIDTAAGVLGLSSTSTNAPLHSTAFGGVGANRSVTITPQVDQFGTAAITITVSDGALMASRTFNFTVNNINDAPTISMLNNLTIDEDSGDNVVSFTVGDSDTPLGSVGVFASSTDLTIHTLTLGGSNPNRTLTINPALNSSGSATITVTATDGMLPAARTFLLTISPVNDAPTISASSNVTADEDSAASTQGFTIDDIDSPLGTLTVSSSSSNPALHSTSISGAGGSRDLTITPLPNQFGTAIITVTVSDGTGTSNRTIVLTINPIDDLPTLSDITNMTLDEDVSTGAIPYLIGDIDDPVGGWTLAASSSNTTLFPSSSFVLGGSGTNRTLAVTPALNQFGTGTITVTFTSRPGSSISDTFTITVNPVNDPPAISFIPNLDLITGTTMVGPIAFTLTDPETASSELSLNATSSNPLIVPPAGLVLTGTDANRTVTVNGIPATAIGSSVISLIVTDGILETLRQFILSVGSPPPPPPSGPPPGPTTPPVVPPGAVTGLQAIARGGGAIDLSWNAAPAFDQPEADPPTGYRIEVGSGAGLSNVATFTTGVTTSFTVTGLPLGTHFIRVRAFNSAGNGAPSNEVVVTLVGGPGAPRNLQATVSGHALQLSWQPPEGAIAVLGYQLEVGSASGRSDIVVVTVPGLSIDVDNAAEGTYFARVKAIDATGPGQASNEVTVVVGSSPVPCTTPAPPRNLTGNVAGTIVQLSWQPPASGLPVSYRILVGSASGQANIASIPIDGSITTLTSPAPDGTFFVRLVAVSPCGSSGPSNEVTISVGAAPPPPPVPTAAPGVPGSLSAQVVGDRVTLTWSAPLTGGAVSRYIIEVTSPAGNPIITVDTGNAATAFSHTGAPPGVYVVRVRAANSAGIGPPTATTTVTIGP